MAPECFGAKKAKGRFGVKIECLCFHGDGCPCDPRRQKKRSKVTDCSACSNCCCGDLFTWLHTKFNVHRQRGFVEGVSLGEGHQPSFFYSSSSLLKSKACVGARVEAIHAAFTATGFLEPQKSITTT